MAEPEPFTAIEQALLVVALDVHRLLIETKLQTRKEASARLLARLDELKKAGMLPTRVEYLLRVLQVGVASPGMSPAGLFRARPDGDPG